MEEEKLTIYLNGDTSQHLDILWHSHLSIEDIKEICFEQFNLKSTDPCRIFDSVGNELWDDDLEYVHTNEPLFLSKGEDYAV